LQNIGVQLLSASEVARALPRADAGHI
jgi:hypothetical protein